jgi:LysM repeat protein
MSDKESAQNVIDAYRRRQKAARKVPLIFVIAVILLLVGAVLLIFWFLGGDKPVLAFLASDTPTPTETGTPTNTATNTSTPTITLTETATFTEAATATQSGPFIYQVQEGDNLWQIAENFKVDLLVLITVNNLDPANPTIRVGDKLIIPAVDTKLPTPTPLPTNIGRGVKIEYQVQKGDSLLSIAMQFNSTVDAIKKENEIDNENQIFVGQKLIIQVNLVTPVPTATNTPEVILSVSGTPVPTAITPLVSPTATTTATATP